MKRQIFIATSVSAALAGCSPIGTALNNSNGVRNVLSVAERLDYALASGGMAREYPESAVAPV
ncbi:MAG: hypothetical protein ACYDBM_06710, partial [Candidatus Tyrphobacter sp.]